MDLSSLSVGKFGRRWCSQVVRILNHRLEQIAIHCRQDPGQFRTLPDHIVHAKINAVERDVANLLGKVQFCPTLKGGKYCQLPMDFIGSGQKGPRSLSKYSGVWKRKAVLWPVLDTFLNTGRFWSSSGEGNDAWKDSK